MFQLILHHTYKLLGEAVDVSGLGTHGQSLNVQFAPDGITAGSGAIVYHQAGSRVRVRPHPVFDSLRALKIEAWVKLDALGQRRNIIEGDSSFAFFIHPDGSLWGTFLGPMTNGGPLVWHGANTINNSPDGGTHLVPVDQWVKLTYVHDGSASLRLYMDDDLVATNYGLISAVRPVVGHGVHIGNWPAGDQYPFAGEIDEVKVWRYDPDHMTEAFFCRPTTPEVDGCWAELINGLARLREDGASWERTIGYLRCVRQAEKELIRIVRSQGEEAIAEAQDFSRRYEELWCAGLIASPEMEQLLREWRDWLVDHFGDAYGNYVAATKECWDRYMSDLPLAGVDLAACDPDFATYLQLLAGLL